MNAEPTNGYAASNFNATIDDRGHLSVFSHGAVLTRILAAIVYFACAGAGE